nr:uncharacterized protein [Tanacetum cinerariifolium]
MRLVPQSPDDTPALYIYPLNFGDDSSDEDLSDTAKSLHTQSASTSVVHTSPTQSLPTCLVLANQPKKEIPMAVGYRHGPSENEEWTSFPLFPRLRAKSNNETQLVNDPFKSWAEGLGIKLVSTSVYHPQANGAVEIANRSIMQDIKTRLHQERGAWVEELPDVLWAHRTTPKTSNEETPFSLAYGTFSLFSYFPAMSKNDIKDRVCTLSKNDLKDLVKTYRIPLDLHPRLPDPGFTMDHLPAGAIGIYSEAILDHLTSRHSCLCVYDDLPTDGYDRNDEERLCARLICLREMRDEVLFRSGLKMSIYDFMTLPSWSDAKIVEESHQLPLPLLERVLLHTTAPTMEGVIISLPIPDEIVASLPDSRLVKNSKELDQAEGANQADLADLCAKIEDSLERDKGISMRDVSALTAHLGKRLGAPPSIAVVSASKPSYVGTLIPASTFGCSLSLGGVVASGRVGKSGAEVMQRQMDPLDCLTRSALARDAEFLEVISEGYGYSFGYKYDIPFAD